MSRFSSWLPNEPEKIPQVDLNNIEVPILAGRADPIQPQFINLDDILAEQQAHLEKLIEDINEKVINLEATLNGKIEKAAGDYTKTKKAIKAVEGLLREEVKVIDQTLSKNFEDYKVQIGTSLNDTKADLTSKVNTVHNNHVELASRVGRKLNDIDLELRGVVHFIEGLTLNTLIVKGYNLFIDNVKKLFKINNRHD